MFQQFIQTIRSRTANISKLGFIQSQSAALPSQQQSQPQAISKQERDYRKALSNSHSFISKVLLGESEEVTLLKRCVQNQVDTEKVLEYGEQAIWDLYCQKDYLNVIRSGEEILPYLSNEITKENMGIGHLSLIMAEACMKQHDFVRTLRYLKDAEESFHLNQEELSEYECSMNYYYSLKIGQLYSKLNMIDKSYLYAIMCLKTKKLSFQQKLPPCQLILNYYITKKEQSKAIEFGKAILNQVSFRNILVKCRPEEIESICEIYKVMINLELNKHKQYILIDQFLLLLSITKSSDTKLIEQLEQNKSKINEALNNQQEDLLFVLGFYGQKLKLETQPEQKSTPTQK